MNGFQVTSLLLDFIVDANLSFNVSQEPSLRVLLETVAGRQIPIPSRYKLMAALDTEFKKVKNTLKQVLMDQKHLCLTADVWTSHAQSYLGVTVHFLNKWYQRESYLLAFKQMKKKQSYDVLAKALDDILMDYGISPSKITNIVTDGGSAFCKLFQKYGDHLDCTVQYTSGEDSESGDEELDESDVEVTEPDTEQTMIDENGDGFVGEVLALNNEISAQPTDDTNYDNYFELPVPETAEHTIKMPPQRRCYSHLLNLLSKDFEKKLGGMEQKAFKTTFDALHTLWSITRKSARAKFICKEELGEVLKFPCETRWNSRFDCVKQCNRPEIQGKLNSLIDNLKKQLNSESSKQLKILVPNNFNVLQQYENVMAPVARALDILQGENNCNQGDILPVISSMKMHISRLPEDQNIIRDFKSTMLQAINDRFGNLFVYNAMNKDFILGTITSPQYKTGVIQKDMDKLFAKNLLIDECKKIQSEIDDRIDSNDEVIEAPVENDFIISFENRDTNRRNSIENNIESEVSKFLVDPNKQYCMLNQYPTVRAVFFKYNTTLPSSAAVERVFSQFQMIFTPRRNRISAESFEKTLILKHNRMLIEQFKKKNEWK